MLAPVRRRTLRFSSAYAPGPGGRHPRWYLEPRPMVPPPGDRRFDWAYYVGTLRGADVGQGPSVISGGRFAIRLEPRETAMTSIRETSEKVAANVERVIVGKDLEVRQTLVALLCRGHLLIEDVPGTGKTMLAKSVARSLGCTFRRLQFTPDLLPSDVTGVSIYNQKTREFEFRPGPIMAQVVLADEINRATPKTQSALLECMEERQATIDGTTYQMPDPFMVIATQNPIEYEGTFALPEAQLDRFMLRIRLGYPDPEDEQTILDSQKTTHPIDALEPVLGMEELRELQAAVREIYVDPAVAEYIVRLVGATRTHPDVYLGASPRGSLALYRAGQAIAAMAGRDFVIPDDVKSIAEAALAHRLIIKTSASMHDIEARQVVSELLGTVPVEVARPGSPADGRGAAGSAGR